MAALGPVTLALQLLVTDVGSVAGAVLLIRLAIMAGNWWRKAL